MTPYIFPGMIEIDDAVSFVFGVEKKMLKERTRKMEVVQARQVAMRWRKMNTKQSLQQIAEEYGDFDHATVVHATKTINNFIKIYPEWREKVAMVENMLPKCENN